MTLDELPKMTINFHCGPALTSCDRHPIYKDGAKEIAARQGMSITFMAKYDRREGSFEAAVTDWERVRGFERL